MTLVEVTVAPAPLLEVEALTKHYDVRSNRTEVRRARRLRSDAAVPP